MTKWGALSAAAALLAGCGGSTVPNGPIELDKLRNSDIPAYYLGESFGGLEISYADRSGDDGVLVAYGTCETPGGFLADGGCSPPLQIRICSGAVVIFGGRAIARRAAQALVPLNDAARRLGKPYGQLNHGVYC